MGMINASKNLADFMVVRTDVTTAHEKENALGLDVANRFVALHIDGVELIRREAVEEGRDEFALVMLGVHVLNLYTSVMEFAIRGRFDVGWHLCRAMFDGRSLSYAVAKDPQQASRFLEGELKASEARTFTLEDLAATGYEDEAVRFGDRWKRNADASNVLSHVNSGHLGMLASQEGGEIIAHYGGRVDPQACRLLMASAHEEELWFLTNLEHLRKSSLPDDWSRACLSAKARLFAFQKKYESEWNRTNDTEQDEASAE